MALTVENSEVFHFGNVIEIDSGATADGTLNVTVSGTVNGAITVSHTPLKIRSVIFTYYGSDLATPFLHTLDTYGITQYGGTEDPASYTNGFLYPSPGNSSATIMAKDIQYYFGEQGLDVDNLYIPCGFSTGIGYDIHIQIG